jgi:general stress protein 26
MADEQPVTELDGRYSSDDATPTPWETARRGLAAADVFWLVTVRPDGRPHATPLLSVWLDDKPYFCTGPSERKAGNLEHNPHCLLLTGTGSRQEGLDIGIEGDAIRVTDDATLRRAADAWVAKYGSAWRFTVSEGGFRHAEDSRRGDDPGPVLVYKVVPATAFGFGKGAPYSQTRWRFG